MDLSRYLGRYLGCPVILARWLRHARPGDAMPPLIVNPERPGRVEPRCRKRRPKQYDLMNKPRDTLRKLLENKRKAA